MKRMRKAEVELKPSRFCTVSHVEKKTIFFALGIDYVIILRNDASVYFSVFYGLSCLVLIRTTVQLSKLELYLVSYSTSPIMILDSSRL